MTEKGKSSKQQKNFAFRILPGGVGADDVEEPSDFLDPFVRKRIHYLSPVIVSTTREIQGVNIANKRKK